MTIKGISHPGIIVLMALAVACGAAPTGPTTGAPVVTVSAVSINITGVRNPMAVGDVEPLRAVATLADGSNVDVTTQAAWQSGDSAVFSVSSAGVLTAVGKGLTGVTATYGGVTTTAAAVVDQPGCTYLVSPAAATFERGVNAGTSTVTTQPGCAWTVASDADWLSLSGAVARVGSGSISYTTTFLDGSLVVDPRSAHVMVRWDTPTAGQNVAVTQTSVCRNTLYAVTPSSTFGPDGGAGHLEAINTDTIFPPPGKDPWQINSTVEWITVTSPTPGQWIFGANEFDIHFTVSPNSTGLSRTGELVSCGSHFGVTQAGQ